MVALESTALKLAKTIVQKAAGAWIADRRTAEERKKELSALLTPRFRRGAPEQQFLKDAASELASFGRYEFRGLDDGDRAAALLAVGDAFERADLTDRTLFAVDVDPAKLARRLRAGQPGRRPTPGLARRAVRSTTRPWTGAASCTCVRSNRCRRSSAGRCRRS